MGAAGCSTPSGGTISVRGLGESPVTLECTYPDGAFAVEAAQVTVAFSTIPYEALADGTARDGTFLHVEVLWRPKAGATAIVPDATNLSIRYVVVSQGEVGVYGGGGFAWVTGGTDEDETIVLEITGSTIGLLDRTPGFVDLLSPAAVLGELGASRNTERARATCRAASQFVTNRLGHIRYVRGGAAGGAGESGPSEDRAVPSAAAASAAASAASSGSRSGSAGS